MIPTKQLIYIGAVFIMLSTLLKAFGMSKPPTEVPIGATRHVNISGNIFSFAMPENFSRDMPAEPLVENLDLNTLTKDSTGLLIQRWWDIKEPGFFGKALGTTMMTINVYQVPQNTRQLFHKSPYDIQDRFDLIFMIDESIRQRHKDSEETGNEFDYSLPNIFHLMGTRLVTSYRDRVYGNQKWTCYSILGHNDQLLVNCVLPIDDKHFIEVSSHYSPNNRVMPRYFLDWAYKITSPIEESLHMQYKEENPLKMVVEQKWLNSTTNESLDQKKEDLVKKLFSPESYEMYRLDLEQEK